jgi:5,10-methylenetetrahydromethanopterin reductase
VEGEFVKVRDLTLDLGHGVVRTPKDVKIYLGPTGPLMHETAGEIADGAILNGLLSADYTRRMVAKVRAAAMRAGRFADAIDLPQLINIAMSDDEDRARHSARYVVTKYLGQQPHIGKANGIDPELLARINTTMGGWPARPGGVEDALRLVSDEIVDRMTISGNAPRVKERIEEWIDAGISYPVLLPLSDNYDEMVEMLGPGAW